MSRREAKESGNDFSLNPGDNNADIKMTNFVFSCADKEANMLNIKISAIAAIIFPLFFPLTANASMRPVLKKRAGLPPFTVVRELVHDNDDRAPATEGNLLCAWLADSSPGLTPDRIIVNPAGRMLIVRNATAQMTPEATRSMDLAIRKLHLPVLLITRASDARYMGSISSRPLPRTTAGRKKMLEKEIDNSVRQVVSRYRKRVRNGRLVVIGSIFDQGNWYGRGHGLLLLININGVKDPGALRAHQAAVLLNAEQRHRHLGR